MTQSDLKGARGANAGDNFHELWALRHALSLLDPTTELKAITVEGLRVEDEYGVPANTWDGVDCTFYFGGESALNASHITVDQLKYSAANPDKPWTVARLTYNSNKKENNSVIRRLAQAFVGLKQNFPGVVSSRKLSLRLISNQPAAKEIFDAISNQKIGDADAHRSQLLKASGLKKDEFQEFAAFLDFSKCGSESRFLIELGVLETIAAWTDDDSRSAKNDLLYFIRRMMGPEGKDKSQLINRQTVLAQLGVSELDALFPCPSGIKYIDRPILRTASQEIVKRMLDGQQHICAHGEGGCGKTTSLQEIESMLPLGSELIAYDCYGGGRYLDSNAYRHRSKDAFLQIINEVAQRVRIPYLLPRTTTIDYPRAFSKRLERAAEIVTAKSSDALLVIAIDAADNAVVAAKLQSEKSFVDDFVHIGDLPANVRFLITSRSGRREELNLTREFESIEIGGFSHNETAIYVRGFWDDAPASWIEDFYHFSHGNPRVQQYALEYAITDPEHALEYLLPNGKRLNDVFRERLEEARRKVGLDLEVSIFCAGLIALPRPIPVDDLAIVTRLSEGSIGDLCADLAPGVIRINNSIQIADEDFEDFIRQEAQMHLEEMQSRVAQHFLRRYKINRYAAEHVISALVDAGRRKEVIEIVNGRSTPSIIGDPVLRREVHLRWLRASMRVCREAGNNVEAMKTLLIGAEALKGNETLQRMLADNPDLAAEFARDTSGRLILRDVGEISRHGPLLFHRMNVDARSGNSIAVRETQRQVRAWMQRRKEYAEDGDEKQQNRSIQDWPISVEDIAAEIEATLRLEGSVAAFDRLRRWRPSIIVPQVALLLSFRLVAMGDFDLVERSMEECDVGAVGALFLIVPLALAGRPVDVSRLEAGLSTLVNRSLIRMDRFRSIWGQVDATKTANLDVIVTACEIALVNGGNRDLIMPVLERIASPEVRRDSGLSQSRTGIVDLSLRAYTLLERLMDRKPAVDVYFTKPSILSTEDPIVEDKRRREFADDRQYELRSFIEPLIDLYDTRTQVLLGIIGADRVEGQLWDAISKFENDGYQFRTSPWASEMVTRIAVSMTKVLCIQTINANVVFKCVYSFASSREHSPGSSEAIILTNLSINRSLHQAILKAVAEQAGRVKHLRIAADEKIAILLLLSRTLLNVSHDDAAVIFNDAIDATAEMNAEAIYEIGLFDPLVNCAVSAMESDSRRNLAHSLAIIAEDAGIRLAGHGGLRWDLVGRALTTLHVPIALAAIGRWEDASIVDRDRILPTVLETVLTNNGLTPAQATALIPLLESLDRELIDLIADAILQRGGDNADIMAEELARDEMLQFGRGRRPEISTKLQLLQSSGNQSFWINQLVLATTFCYPKGPGATSESHKGKLADSLKGHAKDQHTSLFPWPAFRFTSAADIEQVIESARESSRLPDKYISEAAILNQMRERIELSDRVAHLEALSSTSPQVVDDYDVARAIATGISQWRGTPAVDRWLRERFPAVVVTRLPGFLQWLPHGKSPLPELLEMSGIPNIRVIDALLEAVEHHIESLGVPSVYAVVGLMAPYCAPDEVARLVEGYSNQLVQRIPNADLPSWENDDIPSTEEEGVARLLYALMGDVDVRIRWRAAHVFRRLALLGDEAVVNSVITQYDRMSERSYRDPNAPFYWLSARLWLVIALDRIADETPSIIACHGHWLRGIACDEGFPHVIVRAFAKSAAIKLRSSGWLTLDEEQSAALDRANTSPVQMVKARRRLVLGSEIHVDRSDSNRRFHFDSIDTLPYWYTPLLRGFARLESKEFLEEAEHWIVDCWGVNESTWKWVDEPRPGRFPEGSHGLWGHRHGGYPRMERYHTYLEWHAMWCATGELMKTHALVYRSSDDYDSFAAMMKSASLSAPPLWLADLRGMKPLQDRLWFKPDENINAWVENADDNDFLAELDLENESGMIVVGGDYSTDGSGFRLEARVETALVSPSTASALVRALQTVDDSWNYRIPPSGNELEIDARPYVLRGWLLDNSRDTGIDELDPFRHQITPIERCPSEDTAKALDLMFIWDKTAKWTRTSSNETVFEYLTWDDAPEHDESRRYPEDVISRGCRLSMDRQALLGYLNKIGLDLIVEVEIKRRNRSYSEDSRYDKEKTIENVFDRLFLLRRDGTIESAGGRVGAWAIPGS